MLHRTSNQHIVIAEDDNDICETYADMLSDQPYDISIARNGYEAIDILERKRADLLIADIRMPNMDGISLCKIAKKRNLIDAAIVISGFGNRGEIADALNAGVCEFMEKPVIENLFLRSISANLKKSLEKRREQRILKTVQRRFAGDPHEADMDEDSYTDDLVYKVQSELFLSKNIMYFMHNIKSPITVLCGLSNILKRSYPKDPKIDRLESSVKTIYEMTTSYLNVKTNINPAQSPFADVNETINVILDSYSHFHASLNQNVNIVKKLGDVGFVSVEKHLLHQIITNIIENAYDSMEESAQKVLTIETSCNSEGFLSISISDTGHGIPEDSISRIMDEGYSTKLDRKENKGYGVGMSFVRDTLNLLDGKIDIQSEVGKGTRMNLLFPLSRSSGRR